MLSKTAKLPLLFLREDWTQDPIKPGKLTSDLPLVWEKRVWICGDSFVLIFHWFFFFLFQCYILPDLTQEHAQPPCSDCAPLPRGLSHAAPQQHNEAREHMQCRGLCVRPRPPPRLYHYHRHSGKEEVNEGWHHVAVVWVAAEAGVLQAKSGSANRCRYHTQIVWILSYQYFIFVFFFSKANKTHFMCVLVYILPLEVIQPSKEIQI